MKKYIKQFFLQAGLDIKINSVKNHPRYSLYLGLTNFGINNVLDIGANIGQFAQELREVGYAGKIVSFEPLSDAHKKLNMAAQNDSLWTVHPQTAIGDFDGEIEINISGNSFSSSVLPMLASHSDLAKTSAYIGSEKVKLNKLDTIVGTYVQPTDKYLIKIDTQGFEWQVLDGASNALAGATGIMCEMSLVPLYEGQKLWLEMIERIKSLGFQAWAVNPGFSDKSKGRTLQLDVLFFRDK